MFTLPPLPYSYTDLEPHLDSETMKFHHDMHHAAYVKNLNALLPDKSDADLPEIIAHLDTISEDIRASVRNHGGGVFNHNFFWSILTPAAASGTPGTELETALNTRFGSLADFKTQFTKAAMGQFGSGWAWLVKTNNQLEITTTSNQDSPLTSGSQILLGVDVWEHAYYLKYQNRRAEYLEAWWNVVNWSQVSANFLTP